MGNRGTAGFSCSSSKLIQAGAANAFIYLWQISCDFITNWSPIWCESQILKVTVFLLLWAHLSLFSVSTWFLSLCPPSGICGGAGAAHGPSARYVQAGAQRRRCNSGKEVEILWFWHPEFCVTQELRAHTLRRHAGVKRRAQCYRPVCVRARVPQTHSSAVDGRWRSLKQTLETVRVTDLFFFRISRDGSSPDVGSRWNNGPFPRCRFLPQWTATERYRLDFPSVLKMLPLPVLWSESWALVVLQLVQQQPEEKQSLKSYTKVERLEILMPNFIPVADEMDPFGSYLVQELSVRWSVCSASCGTMGPQTDRFLFMVWKGVCTPTLNLWFKKHTQPFNLVFIASWG